MNPAYAELGSESPPPNWLGGVPGNRVDHNILRARWRSVDQGLHSLDASRCRATQYQSLGATLFGHAIHVRSKNIEKVVPFACNRSQPGLSHYMWHSGRKIVTICCGVKLGYLAASRAVAEFAFCAVDS